MFSCFFIFCLRWAQWCLSGRGYPGSGAFWVAVFFLSAAGHGGWEGRRLSFRFYRRRQGKCRHRFVFFIQASASLIQKRSSDGSVRGSYKTKTPRQKTHLCQGRINTYPRCHLVSRSARALDRDTDISPAFHACLSRRRILCGIPHLTAPSAVHLTTCFLPDSQHRRLSVKA